MFYRLRGYLPLMQSTSLVSLEHLTFWKLSLTMCFVWFIWWYVFRYRTIVEEKRAPLILQKLEDFHPEPLFQKEPVTNVATESIESSPVAINDIDLASNDFLSLRHEKRIRLDAQAAISKYGVGSCGPRTFYGTADIHLELEKTLNNWLSTEKEETKVLLYSYHQCTISSVVAAFCTTRALCFIDEQCSQSMRHGLKVKRVENVVKFKHNSAKSLEEQLAKYFTKIDENTHKLQRCFLLVEGLYYNTGQILSLDLLNLARKYKIRIILDESLSIGTLGQNGRGIVEYYNLNHRLDFIDITIGSFEHALHSIGGFTICNILSWYEQQLLSTGYLFSASLPVFCAKAVLTGLTLINDRDFNSLSQLANEVQLFLTDLSGVEVCSSMDSPLKVLIAKNVRFNIKSFYNRCKSKGVYMVFKNNAVQIANNNLKDAVFLQLKLEFLTDSKEKLERFYRVLKEAHKDTIINNY